MDEVIGFYNVSKEVDQIIKNGPASVPLDEFMTAMANIESAVKHFERNNSQSVELENLVKYSTFYVIANSLLFLLN